MKNYSRYQRYFYDILSAYQKRTDLKAFLEIILSLGTIILFGIFALRPTFLTIATLLTQIDEKKKTVAQMDQKIANLNQAQNVLSIQAQNVALLKEAVPDQFSPQIYASQIQALASKNGVTLARLTTSDLPLKSAEPSAQPMTVSLSATGEYQNLSTFLTEFEKLLRPMDIVMFAIENISTGDIPELTLSITGNVPHAEIKK